MALKLAVFDLDGTLLVPTLDFEAIRTEIGLPPVVPILETMEALRGPERERAFTILDRREAEAAARSALMPGARALLDRLRERGVRTAVLTRNSRTSVETAQRRHGLRFDAIVTREDHKPKPCPDGVRHLMGLFGAAAAETVVIGDYRFDVESGRAAGVRTVALLAKPKDWAAAATWTAATLDEVGTILDRVAAEP